MRWVRRTAIATAVGACLIGPVLNAPEALAGEPMAPVNDVDLAALLPQLQALLAEGKQAWERGRTEDAQRSFAKIIALHDKAGRPAGQVSAIAAEAQFMVAEIAYLDWINIRMNGPELSDLLAQIETRKAQFSEVTTLYKETLKYQKPYWSAASLYRIASSFEAYADAFDTLACPDVPGKHACTDAKAAVADTTKRLRSEAKTLYLQLSTLDRNAKVENEWCKRARARLEQLE